MRRIFHPTELAPCGVAGALRPVYMSRPASLDDCMAAVRGTEARGITIWEPIATKAPGPHLTRAWCCYVRTVIFYVFPHVSRGPHLVHSPRAGWYWERDGRAFVEWDRNEARLSWDDVVALGDARFHVDGGGVRWARGRWWWLHRCRAESRSMPL